jgi:NAD(P)-dependent dehydrogenase (short-subunit alcohol dehydrogenase family)
VDLVSHGITVTAIAPGPTLTPGVLALTGETNSEEGKAWANDYIQKLMPIRRRGESDEIAKVALFLASSASDFMTDQTVVVKVGLPRVRSSPFLWNYTTIAIVSSMFKMKKQSESNNSLYCYLTK